MTAYYWFEQYRISMLFYMIFLAFFMPMYYRKWKTALILIAGYAITALLDYYFFFQIDSSENTVMLTAVEIVLIQGQAFFLCKYRDFRAFFVGITASVYVLSGNVAGFYFYEWGLSGLSSSIGQILIHVLLLALIVWKIRGIFLTSLEVKKFPWAAICIIPALFYLVFFFMIVWPSNLYEIPSNLASAVVLLILMAVSYSLIMTLLIKQRQETTLVRDNAYLETYAKRLKDETDILQEKEREVAVMRHDMKHYAILTRSYLDAGEPEKISELLEQLDDRLKTLTPKRFCENLSVDGIITHMSNRAKKKKIDFIVDTQIPQKLSLNEYEFATVISNLLENAINAAEKTPDIKSRCVKIHARVIKGQIILEVCNTCGTIPRISKETGLPVSDPREGHGYGTKSVKAFLDKNHGVYDCSIEGQWMIIRILVNITE